MTVVAFALAAAAASAVRAGLGWRLNRHLPFGTLAANVLASFVVGVAVGTRPPDEVGGLAVLAVGGALGTWSALVNEVAVLLREDRPTAAAGYLAASLVLGVVAAAAGLAVGP
jgi:fluoride exporter